MSEPGPLRTPRAIGLVIIAALVAVASVTSFAESYRGLYSWAVRHGLAGAWAYAWPLQVDVFIAVGELALFVALADAWDHRSRIGAWAVTLAGLAVSVAGNVGHVAGHDLASRVTAAIPPLAAAAALAVGLGVLKRVVASADNRAVNSFTADVVQVPPDVIEAAKASLRATIAAGNPLSVNQLQTNFSLTRSQATKLRRELLPAPSLNGSAPDAS